jgi:DNA-binding transcriptional MerR regulator
VLTIGQLARRTGVPAKTVRFYHSIGLLAEPVRDGSGYRRYTAADAVALVRVRALAEAGIPLAQIRSVLEAGADDFRAVVDQVELDVVDRIARLQDTVRRLRQLARDGEQLPAGVGDYLDLLRRIGLSAEWIAMERDLWILAFATHPDSAAEMLADQHQAKTLPEVQQVYRDYDRARDLDPDDPRLGHLAERILRLSRVRYSDHQPPSAPADSPIPQLMQDLINSTSPAWRRLDGYLRASVAKSSATPAYP